MSKFRFSKSHGHMSHRDQCKVLRDVQDSLLNESPDNVGLVNEITQLIQKMSDKRYYEQEALRVALGEDGWVTAKEWRKEMRYSHMDGGDE